MRRLELTFLHLATGGGCFTWRDEDSTDLQSEWVLISVRTTPAETSSVAAAILFGVAIWGTLGSPHVTPKGHAQMVSAF
jgi:hypothetical protein